MSTTAFRLPARVRRSVVALAALGAVVLPASTAEAAANVGRFTTLPAGTAMGLEIDGVAVLSRTSHGTTGLVVLRGLQAGVTYAAHLHKEACGFAGNPGGGHYMNAPGTAAPPNELWFSSTGSPTGGITAWFGGVAIGRGSVAWEARSEARAIVIHAIPEGGTTGGGPKIACADLA